MLVWAAALAVCATAISYLDTAEAGRAVPARRELPPRDVRVPADGLRPGGRYPAVPARSISAHAAVFCGLALATGGLLAMPLGAMLMNYMAYYVGALGAASAHPWKAMALAWAPWAIIRIAGFVTLGVVLGGPVLARIFGFEYRLRAQLRWIALAGAALAGRCGPEMGPGRRPGVR